MNNCDCGGEPHGKFCALILSGSVDYASRLRLPAPRTLNALAERYKPLQLDYTPHEKWQDAETNARLDAKAEHERGDECVECGQDAYTCEHYEEANQPE